VELYRLSTALSTVVTQSVDKPPMAVDSGNQRVGVVQSIDPPGRPVFWAVFKDYQFISDLNSELLVFLFPFGALFLYKEGYCLH